MKFNKVYGKPSDLVKLIEDRGLIFTPKEKPELYKILSRVGYYRLTGYFLPFQQLNSPIDKNKFVPNTTLSKVMHLYELDSNLRYLSLEVLEKIEIALRTSICEHMCAKYGAHWYLVSAAVSVGKHNAIIKEAAKHVDYDYDGSKPYKQHTSSGLDTHARQLFIQHYYKKYNVPAMPPGWMLRECASFGFWARTFDSLTAGDQKSIMDTWKYPDGKRIDHTVFLNWIWSLSIFRNRCAHHSRIVHRSFPFAPTVPKNNQVNVLFNSKTDDLRTLFAVIQILMLCVEPQNKWRNRLQDILNSFSGVDLGKATGFLIGNSTTWDQTDFWKLYP